MRMWKLISFLVLFTTSVVVVPAATAGSPDRPRGPGDGVGITEVGHWSHGPCMAVALEYAVVLYGEGSYLHVVQLGDVEEVVALDVSAHIRDIELRGHYAYIAASNGGLVIVDLNTPENPYVISAMEFADELMHISVVGDFAYLNSTSALRIVDISDPANPFVASRLPMGDVRYRGPEVDDGLAYTVTGYGLMSIIDVTDPAEPAVISSFDLEFWGASDLSVGGGYAYISNGIFGLVTVDVGDSQNPTIVDQVVPGGIWASNVDVAYHAGIDETLAYVGDYNDGAWVLNVSDPENGFVVGFFATDGRVEELVAVDDALVLATGEAGMTIADVSTPDIPAEVGSISAFGFTTGVVVRDNYAYTCDNEGLRIFDTSDPEQPTPVGYLPLSGNIGEISVQGDYAYVAARPSGLHVVDIFDPTAPFSSGLYYANNDVIALTISGSYLYMSLEWGTVICDISDPPNLTEVGSVFLAIGYEIFVRGDYAYVAASGLGLIVLDVSDPTNPHQIGASTGAMLAAYDVVVNDTHAYVADRAGLFVFDITDPTSPTMTSFFPMEDGCTDTAIRDDRLFIGVYPFEIRMYDLADPSTPAEIGTFEIGDYGTDMSTDEKYIYVANRSVGLWILHDDTATAAGDPRGPASPFVLRQNAPNPFNPATSIAFELAEQSAVTLTILDVRGRVISQPILNRQYGSGLHTVSIGSAGLGSGVYFYRLDTDKGSQVRKMTLLK